jgi:hypothetical protein
MQTDTRNDQSKLRDGKQDAALPAANGEGQQPSGTARAEEIVDHLAERLASYTRYLGTMFLRAAARLREEAEDIWAEAQSIRRGEKSEPARDAESNDAERR